MTNLPKIAISVGDLNGIGIEIALKCHEEISKTCKPIYCINNKMLKRAVKKLNKENHDNKENTTYIYIGLGLILLIVHPLCILYWRNKVVHLIENQ